MSETQYVIAHDQDGHRFTVTEDGLTAELNYRTSGSEMIITHIGVPRPLEGRGIGSALAKAGLEYAREQGMEVVPLCPFVRSYIERKPEYQPLVRSSSGGFA